MQNNICYLEKLSDSYTLREPYTDNKWDRGDTCTDWEFFELHKSTKGLVNYERVVADFELVKNLTVFLVVAVWDTGDTFGWDQRACSECFGIYKTEQEAKIRIAELTNDKSYKIPWNGYFENLDSINILERKINFESHIL